MDISTRKKLDQEQLKELNIIMSLIDKYKSETDSSQKNQLIKMLAVRHVITKGYLVKEVAEMIDENDIKFVKMVDGKIREILLPIYAGLVETASNHCKEWFLAMQRKKGVTNPRLYKYQFKLIKWVLRAIIMNELSEAIYTLLVSRGKENCPSSLTL